MVIHNKAANFRPTRVVQDAQTIADLLLENGTKDARIAELHATLAAIEARNGPKKPKE